MATITYNRDIPDAPNNPSNDQPKMKENANGTYDIINIDHYTFGSASANDGRHKQVQLPVLGAKPVGLQAGEGTLYTKTSGGESQLFYNSDNTASEYQLTRTSDANFTKFATNTNYVGNNTGGWTYLPGGMIMQYGQTTLLANAGTVTYPFTFTNPAYSIIALTSNTVISTFGSSTTGFQVTIPGVGTATVKWVAIGV